MNLTRSLTVSALLFSLGSTVAASPFMLNSGSWEFDIKYDLIGLPQTFPGYSQTQCIDSSSPFPSINRPGNECRAQLQGQFGNTYTWTLNCSDDWEMVQGMGRVHYQQETAHGDIHLQILNPHNPPQMMEFSFKGRRVGECGG